jgi:hypothetical protein
LALEAAGGASSQFVVPAKFAVINSQSIADCPVYPIDRSVPDICIYSELPILPISPKEPATLA